LKRDDLETEWTGYAAERDRILGEALGAFNALFEQYDIPAVRTPEEPQPEVEPGDPSKG
jgi:hypothetical protein